MQQNSSNYIRPRPNYHQSAIGIAHSIELHYTGSLTRGPVIIVVELDENKDPFTSIGQSTADDLFLEVLSARIHLAYCLSDIIREMVRPGYRNEEARWHR